MILASEMKSFLLSVIKQVLAFIVAIFLVGTLFFILIFALIGIIERAPVHVHKDSVLVIDLSMDITDAEETKPFIEHAESLFYSGADQTAYLLEVLDAIELATKDSRIVGMFLKGSHSNQSSGYPVLNEVRKAIETFQTSGKPVIAYFTEADVKDYFLGSVANTLILNPLGLIQLKGLSAEMTYFGDAFEKYGIGMQVTKYGKYKSAVEPFISNHMSDFEKEQLTVLLDDMWDTLLTTLAESRKLNKEDLKTISEKTALLLPNEAIGHKLVDLIEYEDQAFAHFNIDSKKKDFSDHKITLKKYIRDTENKKLLKKVTELKPKIAVVYIEGDISEGNGSSFNAGADRLDRKINEIHDDNDIKAVVLRVNSPGGGVHASEKILRALRLLQAKKPVVVSFGSYATSGGYWISCYGNAIFTDPMTITGSIGVFSLLPNIQKIAQTHGINFEEVSTGPLSSICSYTRPRTEKELAQLQNYTDLIYQFFLTRVIEGRKMDANDVEKIADGRVWSGLKAKQIGLADFYGGLKDAIAHAASLASLSEWETSQYTEHGLGYEIIRHFKESSESHTSTGGVFSKYFNYIKKEIKSFSNYNDPSSTYARLPYTFLLN